MSDEKLVQALGHAREQADEAGGFLASGKATAHKTGEVFTVIHPKMFDDDQQAEFNRLQHLLNRCDRHPDYEVPEHRTIVTAPDGTVTETVLAGNRQRGDYIEPYQLDGDLVEPPYQVQITAIILGADEYARFKAGGGRSVEVVDELLRMQRETVKRVSDDPKSD